MANYRRAVSVSAVAKAKIAIVYNLFKALFSCVLDFIFPKKCVGCGVCGDYFCQLCISALEYLPEETCIVCEKPSRDGFTHPFCATKFTPERHYCGFRYTGVLRKAILAAKYRGVYSVLNPVLQLFVDDMVESGIDIGEKAVVIAVPLHFLRRLSRGYNQSEYIAQFLARAFNIEVLSNVLVRRKETKKQFGLNRKERFENLKNAFAVNNTQLINGCDIVLVDDIETSGATLLAASMALKLAGARYIYCLALAKD